MTKRLQITFRPSIRGIDQGVAVKWFTPILASRLTANDKAKRESRPLRAATILCHLENRSMRECQCYDLRLAADGGRMAVSGKERDLSPKQWRIGMPCHAEVLLEIASNT